MAAHALLQPQHVPLDLWLGDPETLPAREPEPAQYRERTAVGRRRLPLAKIEKDYVLDGPNGKQTIAALFDGRPQLVVHHFMFEPTWNSGCAGCVGYVDALGDWSILNRHDATFMLVSRAPLAKLDAYKAQRGWSVPWYSSFGSDFTHDFYVTFHAKVSPVDVTDLDKVRPGASNILDHDPGKEHGLSVFCRRGDDIFHTYSVCARDVKSLCDA